jgi:hypothetical protein
VSGRSAVYGQRREERMRAALLASNSPAARSCSGPGLWTADQYRLPR